MRETLLLLVFLVGAFVVSAVLGHIVAGRRRPVPNPTLGSTLRIRGTGGQYRAKLLGYDNLTWRISCPLSRNNYVPLRVQDKLTVEAPMEDGVIIFRTQVTSRDEENHEFLLAAPENPTVTDRRSEKRKPIAGVASIEGETGELVDISSLGARILTNRPCHVGERVRVELNGGMIYAWVLDFWPTRAEGYRETIRVRFEEVLTI